MSENITTVRHDAVLHVRLDRPAKKNALTGAMYRRLTQVFDAADSDDDIAALVISGAGGAFTAGNDIGDFVDAVQHSRVPDGFTFIQRLARFETPLIAAVEGPAVGIGTTLLLHCDLVYAAASASFRLPFVDLGLVPEAGSSLLLPQRVGTARAAELLMLARAFSAAEAHAWGLVNAIVADGALIAHALAQARALADKPRAALAATRRLLRGDRATVMAQLDAEGAAFQTALQSPEAQAAFAAFLARQRSN